VGRIRGASGGKAAARKGLASALGDGCSDWRHVGSAYRRFLFGAGEEKGGGEEKRRGIRPDRVRNELERAEAPLAASELLLCRVRYFTDGLVIGSKGFVAGFLEKWRGAPPAAPMSQMKMRGGDWGGMCSARQLRVDVLAPPPG
jgi:hypothetical protein